MNRRIIIAAASALVFTLFSGAALAGPHGWQGDRNYHSQRWDGGYQRYRGHENRSYGCDGHIGPDGDCHGTWRGAENDHSGRQYGYYRDTPPPPWAYRRY